MVDEKIQTKDEDVYAAFVDSHGHVMAAGPVRDGYAGGVLIDEVEYLKWAEQPYHASRAPAWRLEGDSLAPLSDPRVSVTISVEPVAVSPVSIVITADRETDGAITLSVIRDGQGETLAKMALKGGRAEATRELEPGRYVLQAIGEFYGEASFIVAEAW